MTNSDDDWEWVIPPESGQASRYQGVDLTDTMRVGERVRELRTSAGLSEQDVEDYAGVRKSDLLAVEAGLLEVNTAMADSLAMVLGVTADELLA